MRTKKMLCMMMTLVMLVVAVPALASEMSTAVSIGVPNGVSTTHSIGYSNSDTVSHSTSETTNTVGSSDFPASSGSFGFVEVPRMLVPPHHGRGMPVMVMGEYGKAPFSKVIISLAGPSREGTYSMQTSDGYTVKVTVTKN